MEVVQDLSFVHLIANASVLVQLVMLLLLAVSMMSWWYIFMKMFTIRREAKLTHEFEEAFWRNPNLNELYKFSVANSRDDVGALERIFAAGFVEFVKLKKQHAMDPSAVMDGTRRAMRATYQREMDRLESHLAFLASVGSVSPYVGLFGTVWGVSLRVSWSGQRRTGDAGACRTRYRRSLGGDRDGLVRGDSGCGGVQPLRT